MPQRFQQLDGGQITQAAQELAQRIRGEFPNKNLVNVADEVVQISREADAAARLNARPSWVLRIVAFLVCAGFFALILVAMGSLRVSMKVGTITELAQGLESAVNNVVFGGVAIWFAFSMESRIKRGRTLELLSKLRSLSHVIDMHQVTKDPEPLPNGAAPQPHHESLTKPAMAHYLSHCSELLSVLGKLAALAVQRFNDPASLSAVDELQDLVNGLSQKIWQKIIIIDLLDAPGGRVKAESVASHLSGPPVG